MVRSDNRGFDKMRKVVITPHYMKYAEGSCLIEVGNTKVVCTASVEDGVPNFLKNTGTGWITAEYGMLPRSCKNRISRDKSQGRTFEIQRLVGRSLRAIASMNALGERTIWLDCDVIQADGGTRTASITGSFIAMCFALNKMRKDNLISKIPINDFIAAVSVGIVDSKPLLDLTYDEDSAAEVDMNVVMTAEGRFVEVQGTGEESTFSKEEMDELLAIATKGIKDLIDIQRGILKDIL